MYYSKINPLDIANGDGIRVTIFVSGCTNHCKNCFQPQTWDFSYGSKFTDETISELITLLSRPYVKGLTLLGGEPMEPRNQRELLRLLREVKRQTPEKDVWCYTGFTFEKLHEDGAYCRCDVTDELLSMIDVLVDGRFIDELKDISLRFRGSSNQRLIDVKMSEKLGEVVTLY